MAAADAEVSVDATIASVVDELDSIFSLEEKQTNAFEAFIGKEICLCPFFHQDLAKS